MLAGVSIRGKSKAGKRVLILNMAVREGSVEKVSERNLKEVRE